MSEVYGQKTNWRVLGGIAVAHAVLFAVLLNRTVVLPEIVPVQPLMVSLLDVPQPRPEVTPPKPRPAMQQPVQHVTSPPALAAPATVPAEAVAVPAAPQPVPVILPAPESAPFVTMPAVAAVPAPPVIPPRFDADYLDNPAPVYPAISRSQGEQGLVILRVLVNAEGRADQVEVQQSSGFDRLDKAARDTVRRWRFVAARQGDHAVPAWVRVPISFQIRS